MNLFGHEVTEDVVKLAFKDVLESVYKAIVNDSTPLFISSLLVPFPPLLHSHLLTSALQDLSSSMARVRTARPFVPRSCLTSRSESLELLSFLW
jgi:hypothetical protein